MVYPRPIVAYHVSPMREPGRGFCGSPSGLRAYGTHWSHGVPVFAIQLGARSSSLSCLIFREDGCVDLS